MDVLVYFKIISMFAVLFAIMFSLFTSPFNFLLILPAIITIDFIVGQYLWARQGHVKPFHVRGRLFTSLVRVLLVVGCIVLVFSILSPFCKFYYFWSFHGGVSLLTFWSYKYNNYYPIYHQGNPDYFFLDYWGSILPQAPAQNGMIALVIFLFQITTMASSVACLFFIRKILFNISISSSLLVLALMGGIAWPSLRMPYTFLLNGFWLALASFALFLSAFIFNELAEKKMNLARA